MPADAFMKYSLPFISRPSIVLVSPEEFSILKISLKLVGMPMACASILLVPEGIILMVHCVPRRQLATAAIVPSPPMTMKKERIPALTA